MYYIKVLFYILTGVTNLIISLYLSILLLNSSIAFADAATPSLIISGYFSFAILRTSPPILAA